MEPSNSPVRSLAAGETDFDQRVSPDNPGLWSAERLNVVQVNIGLKCNLTCRHCHVSSSPRRREMMDWPAMAAVINLATELKAEIVDITGGAPEMHPEFRRFVSALRERNFHVIVRTNLTILLEPDYSELPEFFREHKVELVASLPCYLQENVDHQRGEGVYGDSITAIRRLNDLGYGIQDHLPLTLIYNPGGPALPPPQNKLEADYRRELDRQFGIRFTRLHTITNVPIGRFRSDLRCARQLEPYQATLRKAFNDATVDHLMCRHQISVAWDGTLYDCDFNLALRLPAMPESSNNVHDVEAATLVKRRIATGEHCFACTAGAGSSCGGALT